jgi:transposase
MLPCPPPHSSEFRRRAITLARARTKPIAEVAKDLRISESCLRNWVAQADADEHGDQTRLISAKKEELAQPRRIASIVLSRDLILVTRNVRHFQRVPELSVENWIDEI